MSEAQCTQASALHMIFSITARTAPCQELRQPQVRGKIGIIRDTHIHINVSLTGEMQAGKAFIASFDVDGV